MISPAPANQGAEKINTHTTNNIGTKTVLLQTAKAVAFNEHNNSSMLIRVLFDSGSQSSYVTEQVCSKLCLKPVSKEKLQVNTFGGNRFKTKECKSVKLGLQKRGSSEKTEITALSFPVICSTLPSPMEVDTYSYLADLDLADHTEQGCSDGIDVLVGSDFYWKFVTGEIRRCSCGPVAIHSKLGWLSSGSLSQSNAVNSIHNHLVVANSEVTYEFEQPDKLEDIVRSFWTVEAVGILDEKAVPLNEFLPDIKFNEGQYEIQLPWKEGCFELSNHFSLAMGCLRHLQAHLLRNAELLDEYNRIICEQLKKGIIEQASEPQLTGVDIEENPLRANNVCIHYMPHHAVIRRERTTTKIRIVYDGSAKPNGLEPSLNECLQTGPNLIPKLFDVLVKFRTYAIALSADIEKAFLMISIAPSDRDVLRFLWFQEPAKLESKILHFRFTRVVFGLKPSPAILGAVILQHLIKYQSEYPTVVEQISNGLYVDDLITGTDDIELAFKLYTISKRVMKDTGMNLRK